MHPYGGSDRVQFENYGYEWVKVDKRTFENSLKNVQYKLCSASWVVIKVLIK